MCNYQLFIALNVSATAPNPIPLASRNPSDPPTVPNFVEFFLGGVRLGGTLEITLDPGALEVVFSIPHGALRYAQSASTRQNALSVTISGPLIDELSAHFAAHDLPAYLCCSGAMAGSNGINVVGTTPNVTTLDLGAHPVNVTGTQVMTINRVENITQTFLVYSDALEALITVVNTTHVSAALSNIQNSTYPGLIPFACPMVVIRPYNATAGLTQSKPGPYAVCPYEADMTGWTPLTLAASPVTTAQLTFSLFADGPPTNTSTKQYKAWQKEAITKFTRVVPVLPWNTAAAGYGKSHPALQTIVCAQTGCEFNILTHAPAPLFTSQPAGGANGFKMQCIVTLGTTVLPVFNLSATGTPKNHTLSGFTNPLYTFWFVPFTLKLENIVGYTTAVGFVNTGSVKCHGTFWDYSKGLLQGWSDPSVTSVESIQYIARLSFYDPVLYNTVTNAALTSPVGQPNIIKFTISLVRGVQSASLPATPLRFPVLRVHRVGSDSYFMLETAPKWSAHFNGSAAGNNAVTFERTGFSIGLFIGTLNTDLLMASPFKDMFAQTIRAGATYNITIFPPYYEGANVPGGSWVPAGNFDFPISTTLSVTPDYASKTVQCSIAGGVDGRALSHSGRAQLFCRITLRTAAVVLVDQHDVNVTTTAGASRVLTQPMLSQCTTTVISAAFALTTCTLEFEHSFTSETISVTPILYFKEPPTAAAVAFAVGTFAVRSVPLLTNSAPTLTPSAIVLPSTAIVLPSFLLTAPAGQVGERPTISPNLTLTIQLFPSQDTTHVTISAGTPSELNDTPGTYQISIGDPFTYAKLNGSTSATIKIGVPFWSGTQWTFPISRPEVWPVLELTLGVHHEQIIPSLASRFPAAAPAPAEVPLRAMPRFQVSTIIMTLFAAILSTALLGGVWGGLRER
jgi:hypothetical protein